MARPQICGGYSDTDSLVTENDECGEEAEIPVASQVEEPSKELQEKTSIIKWTGPNKKHPLINFSPHVLLLTLPPESKAEAEKYHLTYKFVKTECKLVRSILNVHCFREVHPNSSNFNLMWTGSHIKPHTLRGLQDFQKINHFPRSYELTRKDKLYKNIQRMQHSKGVKHFDFIPESYIIPEEFNEFNAAFLKDRRPWIVKPVASSRGRGIYLVNHPSHVPLDDNLLVCKYISNPLLVDGFKFDLRLYVGVTCFDPVRVYLYEEGLTRFATVKYDRTGKNIKNVCMHLTNYSVNKKNADFVRCPDPEVEDFGNKWSMSAMLRYLKQIGKDTTALMMRIEDVVVKTIIAGELHIASACKMFMPYAGNCFEIYGFDILVDENLRPWLLEVNLSPSLACDSPLDLKIKSHLVSDMFNLIGFTAHDPMVRKLPNRRFVADNPPKNRYQRQRSATAGGVVMPNSRPLSSGTRRKTEDGLSAEEARILRHTREEFSRRGGFVRVFPSPDSWELYGSFLEHRTTHNHMLHSKLFPGRKSSLQRPSTASFSSASARARSIALYGAPQSKVNVIVEPPEVSGDVSLGIKERLICYERKLDSWSPSLLRTNKALGSTTPSASTPNTSQEMSEKPRDTSIARTTPDGQVVTNYMEGKSVSYPGGPKPSLDSEGKAPPYRVSSASPQPRPFQEATRVQKPPLPSSGETVSKRVLSAQPRYQPIRVEEIMAKAGTLTKLQARQAFAMYLQRVQQRLMHETSYDSDDSRDSRESKQDDQMNLVIRFLKKAASNLQQPFKVVVPSHKLPLHDRRRILAKQLGDFVRVYGKETMQFQKRLEINRTYGLSRSNSFTGEIPDEEFKVFMAIASETELEDLLTTYTKLNKNASVFLGGRPERSSEESSTKAPSNDSGLHKRKEGDRYSRSSNPTPDGDFIRPTEDLSSTGPMVTDRHARALTAVSAYGTSVALNKTRHRPMSAKVAGSPGADRINQVGRPVSAKPYSRFTKTDEDSGDPRSLVGAHTHSVQRSRVSSAPVRRLSQGSDNEPKGPSVADEHAVTSALQRLAKRQAARQYSAHNTSGRSGSNWDELFKKMDFNHEVEVTSPLNVDEFISVRDDSTNPWSHPDGKAPRSAHRPHDRHASANATFETFVNHDQQLDGSHSHVVWFNSAADQGRSYTAGARSSDEKTIHVDLKREYDKTQEVERQERKTAGEAVRGPAVSREEYNRQMKVLSQKLSEEKVRLQMQLQQYPCLPRPPAARPNPGPKKVLSHNRMIRLAASNPPPVFDVITGMTDLPNGDSL
ncbi:tubulin polyglutamylase TTLL5 isoform X1 [Pocillopora verrucosa]|uniref:tubulin polyglutamylase TTLL5 isoform X1 n=1 Tax=Pocillopora verrucosa TaxID=203993 RepID=UPI003341C39A